MEEKTIMFSLRTIPRVPIVRSLLGLALLGFPALPGSAQTTAAVAVPGTSDPWLAGAGAGFTASGGDVAPDQSPAQVTELAVEAGRTFSFAATGSVDYAGNPPTDPPDGNINVLTNHAAGAENGISDVSMPADALLGVFVGPGQPDPTLTPDGLDFSTPASRDYLTLLPIVQQVFFIGDGVTSSGAIQKVVAPSGATRLFLGTMDGSGWFNNSGSFNVIVTASAPVPEASTTVSFGLLLAFGLGAVAAVRRKKADR